MADVVVVGDRRNDISGGYGTPVDQNKYKNEKGVQKYIFMIA